MKIRSQLRDPRNITNFPKVLAIWKSIKNNQLLSLGIFQVSRSDSNFTYILGVGWCTLVLDNFAPYRKLSKRRLKWELNLGFLTSTSKISWKNEINYCTSFVQNKILSKSKTYISTLSRLEMVTKFKRESKITYYSIYNNFFEINMNKSSIIWKGIR